MCSSDLPITLSETSNTQDNAKVPIKGLQCQIVIILQHEEMLGDTEDSWPLYDL